MSTSKHLDKLCIFITVLMLILTLLFINGEKLGITVIKDEEEKEQMFSTNDKKDIWDASQSTTIQMHENSVDISGNGAYYDGKDIHIVYAGNYEISGSLKEGSLIVDGDGDDKIWILFNGVEISNSTTSALYIKQADKVFLNLAPNSQNTLTSGEGVQDTTLDGVIYSKDDLTIQGQGSLTINSEYAHGIVGNDDLILTGGKIEINALKDGIHAHDSIRICQLDLTIHAGDDGMSASNDENNAFIYIESGNISIPSCYEGIEAINIQIDGGNIEIHPSDDGINANSKDGSSLLDIRGGDIRIVNENGRDADGLDSNGNIIIRGGNIFVSVPDNGSSAIDYASEMGGECMILGGRIIACGSASMQEGMSSQSSQGYLITTVSNSPAGSVLTLTNAQEETILSETIPASFSCVILSDPSLQLGDTVTLNIGDSVSEYTITNTFENANSFMNKQGMNRMDSFQKNPNEQVPFDRPEPPDDQSFDSQDIPAPPEGEQPPMDMEMPDAEFSLDTQREMKKHDFSEETRNKEKGNFRENTEVSEESSEIDETTILLIGFSFLILIVGFILLIFKRV